MISLAPALVAASSAIVLILGLIHLWYTFRGTKLGPAAAPVRNSSRAGPDGTAEPNLTQSCTG